MENTKFLAGIVAAIALVVAVSFDEVEALLGVSADDNGAQSVAKRSEGSTPSDFVTFGDDFLGTQGQVAVGVGAAHYWIEDVLAGYDPDQTAPGFFQGDLIPLAPTCEVTIYDGTSPVVTVFGAVSGRELPISTDSIPQLNHDVDNLIDRYSRSGILGGVRDAGDQLHVIDVVVPATPEPVHLVLLSTFDDLVWSFHFEQGATLAGVSMIGGTAGGTLNLPENVPLEAISDREMEACYRPVMVQTFFPLSGDGHRQVTDQTFPSTHEELEAAANSVTRNSSQYRKFRFEQWFVSQFNVNPRSAIAGYPMAQVVVAGARPETPPMWTPLGNGQLRLMNGMIYILGDEATRNQAWTDLLVQTAEQKIGGPIETIHPDYQPVTQ